MHLNRYSYSGFLFFWVHSWPQREFFRNSLFQNNFLCIQILKAMKVFLKLTYLSTRKIFHYVVLCKCYFMLFKSVAAWLNCIFYANTMENVYVLNILWEKIIQAHDATFFQTVLLYMATEQWCIYGSLFLMHTWLLVNNARSSQTHANKISIPHHTYTEYVMMCRGIRFY